MKTKILISSLLLYSLTNNAFAQFDLSNTKYKWGISASVGNVEIGDPEWDSWGYAKGNFNNFGDITNKSLSLSIIPKYYISNDILLRFELGIANINMVNYYDANAHVNQINPPSTLILNQTIQQKIYKYAPGIQWNFMKNKFTEFYCGMTASYLHYADMKYEMHNRSMTLPSDSIIGGYDEYSSATGGFAIGIGALAGLNCYIQRNISIGMESSFTTIYYNIGGRFGGQSTYLFNASPPQTFYYATTSYKGFHPSNVLFSVNISITI